MKTKFQIIKKTITSAGEVISLGGETLSHLEHVKGVFVSYSDGVSKPNSTLQLTIDSEEIFPADFEADMIAPKSGIGINNIAWPIHERAKGSPISGKYTDNSPAGGFIAYDVRIVLVCIDKDK
jgi:hypothetical protein